MVRKGVLGFLVVLVCLLSANVFGAVLTDDFSVSHDYLTSGVSGTIWDGFIGQGAGEAADNLNSNMDRTGALFMESTNGRWQDPYPPDGSYYFGPLLYINVTGDFVATVAVTDYESGVDYNAGGLMARVAADADAGAGEDWVSTSYFPMFSVNNKMDSTDNDTRSEIEPWTGSIHSYLMLERVGDNFYGRVSDDGVNWAIELNNGNAVSRSDMTGLAVQVGIWQCTYINSQGYMAFDNFELTYTSQGSASDPDPGDGAGGVEEPVVLGWTGADEAVWHDVYFGDNYDDVNDADNSGSPCGACVYRARQSVGNTSYAVADDLVEDMTYYWRIDEIDIGGGVIEKGAIWSFTMKGFKASGPLPGDGSSGIAIVPTLSWLNGIDVNTHDIYFGDDYAAVLNAKKLYGDIDGDGDVDANDLSIMFSQWIGGPCSGGGYCADIYADGEVDFKDYGLLSDGWLEVDDGVYKGSQLASENSYGPGLLSPSNTYYWRIDEVNFLGSGIVKGDVWSFTTTAGSGTIDMSNDYFDLSFDMSQGGFVDMKRVGDSFETNFLSNPGWVVGDVDMTYRIGGGGWQDARTYSSDDNRDIDFSQDGSKIMIDITYPTASGDSAGIGDFEVSEHWVLDGNNLTLDVDIENTTGSTLELGDLAFMLPFNSNYDGLNTETIQKKTTLRHAFLSGHASHSYWTRVNGVEPYVVMTTPGSDTRFEYWDNVDDDRDFKAFVYSGVTGPATAGTWRQAHTSKVLGVGESLNLQLNFTWANSLGEVRDVLYEDGDIDIECVPGMTVPQDTYALVKLRTKHSIDSIVAEFPGDTTITYMGEPQTDTHIYKVEFSRIGENLLTVNHNSGEQTILEFCSTEPIETLYKKRANHMATYEQVKNPLVWYDGLFGEWDMRYGVLRTPDDNDGMDINWWMYVITCDDPGNAHVPYLAGKNVHYPVQAEIDAVEYYLEHYLWGGMQYTDTEYSPYGILGVVTWERNRLNDPDHFWRVFDYPHIVMAYYHMYEIAKEYPDMVNYLDADGYLLRAYNTAYKYFNVANGWGYEVGTYNEVVYVDLMESLREEGYNSQADALEVEWDKKVKFFVFDKEYPYISEYAMDSTAFESTHALVRWAKENGLDPDPEHPVIDPAQIETFMHGQMKANLAVRGCIEPAFYTYGSDYRVYGQRRYTLSYMSQMGGWAVLDYGLNWTDDPIEYIRLGYGSYLSSWALMNADPTGSNGYWYPGAVNDGATGWAFKPEKNGPIWHQNRYLERGIWYYNGEIDLGLCGALRTSKTIVVDDPVFGLYCYGGDVVLNSGDYEVVLNDGLREWLVMHNLGVELKLSRDAFAAGQDVVVAGAKDSVSFTLENERSIAHTTTFNVSGLVSGTYSVKINSVQQYTVSVSGPADVKELGLSIGTSSTYNISVSKI